MKLLMVEKKKVKGYSYTFYFRIRRLFVCGLFSEDVFMGSWGFGVGFFGVFKISFVLRIRGFSWVFWEVLYSDVVCAVVT